MQVDKSELECWHIKTDLCIVIHGHQNKNNSSPFA